MGQDEAEACAAAAVRAPAAASVNEAAAVLAAAAATACLCAALCGRPSAAPAPACGQGGIVMRGARRSSGGERRAGQGARRASVRLWACSHERPQTQSHVSHHSATDAAQPKPSTHRTAVTFPRVRLDQPAPQPCGARLAGSPSTRAAHSLQHPTLCKPGRLHPLLARLERAVPGGAPGGARAAAAGAPSAAARVRCPRRCSTPGRPGHPRPPQTGSCPPHTAAARPRRQSRGRTGCPAHGAAGPAPSRACTCEAAKRVRIAAPDRPTWPLPHSACRALDRLPRHAATSTINAQAPQAPPACTPLPAHARPRSKRRPAEQAGAAAGAPLLAQGCPKLAPVLPLLIRHAGCRPRSPLAAGCAQPLSTPPSEAWQRRGARARVPEGAPKPEPQPYAGAGAAAPPGSCW